MKISTTFNKSMSSDVAEFTPRQNQILGKALELIREDGLAGMTMRKVAGLMGFSEPAVYRHFKTKQDLVLGIIRQLEINLIDPIQGIAAQTERPVVDRIGDILTHHLELIATNNALPILLFAEAAVSPDERLSQAMAAVFSTYENVMIDLMQEGHAKGEINPALTPSNGAMILMGAPTTCALRMRLLHDVSTKARRQSLVHDIKSTILITLEVK